MNSHFFSFFQILKWDIRTGKAVTRFEGNKNDCLMLSFCLDTKEEFLIAGLFYFILFFSLLFCYLFLSCYSISFPYTLIGGIDHYVRVWNAQGDILTSMGPTDRVVPSSKYLCNVITVLLFSSDFSFSFFFLTFFFFYLSFFLSFFFSFPPFFSSCLERFLFDREWGQSLDWRCLVAYISLYVLWTSWGTASS